MCFRGDNRFTYVFSRRRLPRRSACSNNAARQCNARGPRCKCPSSSCASSAALPSTSRWRRISATLSVVTSSGSWNFAMPLVIPGY